SARNVDPGQPDNGRERPSGRQAFKRRAAPPQVRSEPETDQSAPNRFCTRSDALSVSTGPKRNFVPSVMDDRFQIYLVTMVGIGRGAELGSSL
ncbi:hypothetical protein, partial [Rhodovulum sulfidophilum]|uniref:hypothetical protein n=1 Tax=Rhodovulum sulfidophilum TaxID=35806 RepID=UPI001F333012